MLMQPSVECLSLTIEEVMHIRSVLTKAELECIVIQPDLYNLLVNKKVRDSAHCTFQDFYILLTCREQLSQEYYEYYVAKCKK